MDFDKFQYRAHWVNSLVRIELKEVTRAISLLFLSVLLFGSTGLAKIKVAVFFPTTISVAGIQKTLESDPSYKNSEITVYKKFRDFDSAVKNTKPEVIIAPSEYLDYNKSFVAVAQFKKGGKTKFKYDVVSISKEWNAAKIEAGSVGVVQVLGRKETKKQLKSLVGKKFKKIKRVTKIEDLFPLLALENANYILISPHAYEAVKDKFRADVNYITKSKEVGFPIVAKSKDANVNGHHKINSATIKALGFDGIQKL